MTPVEFHTDQCMLGLSAEEADGITGMFTQLFDGRNEKSTDGVRAGLGREPRSFAAAMTTALTIASATPPRQ